MTPEVWVLHDFLERYDEWVEQDEPSDDWRVAVIAWIHLLQTDPYRGAARRLDLGLQFWFATVPDAEDDRAVCTPCIESMRRTVASPAT